MSHKMLARPPPQPPPHPGLSPLQPSPGKFPGWVVSRSKPGAPQTVSVLHLPKWGQGLGGSWPGPCGSHKDAPVVSTPPGSSSISRHFTHLAPVLHRHGPALAPSSLSLPNHCNLPLLPHSPSLPPLPAVLQSGLCPSATQSPSVAPHSLQLRVYSPEPVMA